MTLRTQTHARRRLQAMTLPEIMVTSTIFGLAISAFLTIHLFALRYDQTVKLKLSACNEARNVLNKMAADIRSAGQVRIGNGSATTFTEITFGQPLAGNAVQIYPVKANTNSFIRYYCDTNDELLKRFVSGEAEVILARSVTNTPVFTSEDAYGRVLSNNFNNRVIGVELKFYQRQDSTQPFLYDYYQLSTKVTRRALE